MGEQIRWSVSVDAETDARRKRLHARIFSMIKSNRSRLVSLVFEWAEFSGFTPENLTAMMTQQQRITGAITEQPIPPFINESQDIPVPGITGKKPPSRVAYHDDARQRRIAGVSRRTVASVAWCTSLIIHSTPLNREVA